MNLTKFKDGEDERKKMSHHFGMYAYETMADYQQMLGKGN